MDYMTNNDHELQVLRKKTIYVAVMDQKWYKDELEYSTIGIGETVEEALDKLGSSAGKQRHFYAEKWDEIELYTHEIIEHNGQTFMPITLDMDCNYWSEYSSHKLIGESKIIYEDIRERESYKVARAELNKKIAREEAKTDEEKKEQRRKEYLKLSEEFGNK